MVFNLERGDGIGGLEGCLLMPLAVMEANKTVEIMDTPHPHGMYIRLYMGIPYTDIISLVKDSVVMLTCVPRKHPKVLVGYGCNLSLFAYSVRNMGCIL